ncbi:hypothetical protein [Burkholderia alba]|uniref:hypothetical protein n=1 Tax=Burkholderia alba TaxID=2683677 RepID=UPI002B05978D|nr:hypothetical protein [Burkholderia alba]
MAIDRETGNSIRSLSCEIRQSDELENENVWFILHHLAIFGSTLPDVSGIVLASNESWRKKQ